MSALRLQGSLITLAVIALGGLALGGLRPDFAGAMEGTGPAAEEDGRAVVLFVADGDTVRVRWRGRREWVRLLRIDTPERDEAGYGASRDALAELVGGREVRLVFEKDGVEERDVYGRLLAYLFLDGVHVNVMMVRMGWSPFWTSYGEGRYAPAFRRAEDEARKGGRGIWASVDTPSD